MRQVFLALIWTGHIDFKLISGHIFSWSTGDALARSGSGSWWRRPGHSTQLRNWPFDCNCVVSVLNYLLIWPPILNQEMTRVPFHSSPNNYHWMTSAKRASCIACINKLLATSKNQRFVQESERQHPRPIKFQPSCIDSVDLFQKEPRISNHNLLEHVRHKNPLIKNERL